jgi:hypothetical protein
MDMSMAVKKLHVSDIFDDVVGAPLTAVVGALLEAEAPALAPAANFEVSSV